ncbi:winged helix DNA-binding domain-containing protein [Levilactobacillus hammesii]|uniref:Winged helix DNA-binding domain-containing protein n=1 Tax=Levilactobacillus hammesii DSM 16381 TaxID=1423753 RepID=A0A0R1URG7_9LACO|nr:winged helix DNA-binding domain-containing protein [Levilactobacillus hammesii]KRL95380.1 hypothetical protein FD28_GL002343 [Levilactobacillus hammesii DSM 16381]
MNQAELFAYRLYQQGLLTTSAELAAPFTNIVGLQAQNQREAELNVALQTGVTREQLYQFYREQGIVRTWAQRWTIHLLTPADWRLVISARQNERLPKAYFQGFAPQVMAAVSKVAQVLQETGQLTRADYAAYLQENFDWYASRPHYLDYAILQVLTARGQVWLKPTTDEAPGTLFAPVEGHLLAQQLATEELIRRYLQGFGPATIQDFVKWSGIKITNVRPAWQQVAPEMVPVTVDGTQLWLLEEVPAGKLAAIVDQVAHLTLITAGFSSLMTGYRDKAWFAPEKVRQQLWTKNGLLRAPIMANGTVVGRWSCQVVRQQVQFQVTCWGAYDHNQLDEDFDRVARFLQVDYGGYTLTDAAKLKSLT